MGKKQVIESWTRYFNGPAPFLWSPDRVSVSATADNWLAQVASCPPKIRANVLILKSCILKSSIRLTHVPLRPLFPAVVHPDPLLRDAADLFFDVAGDARGQRDRIVVAFALDRFAGCGCDACRRAGAPAARSRTSASVRIANFAGPIGVGAGRPKNGTFTLSVRMF